MSLLDCYEQSSNNALQNVLCVRQPHNVIPKHWHHRRNNNKHHHHRENFKFSASYSIFRRANEIVKSYHWLRHASLSVCLSVCLSVRPSVHLSVCPFVRPFETTRLPLDGFSWNLIYEYFFFKCVGKIQVRFKLDKNNVTGTLNGNQYTFLIVSPAISFRMRNFSDKICGVNQNTHFMFSNFFPKNRAV
jgi:hypothetical protein